MSAVAKIHLERWDGKGFSQAIFRSLTPDVHAARVLAFAFMKILLERGALRVAIYNVTDGAAVKMDGTRKATMPMLTSVSDDPTFDACTKAYFKEAP